MLPEGILERWFVADGETAREGHGWAQIRIEGALHDIVAPATGRLTISASKLAVIEPDFLLATLAVVPEAICCMHPDDALEAKLRRGRRQLGVAAAGALHSH